MSRIMIIAAALIFQFLYFGCMAVTVKEELFLQKVDVAGPIVHPPIQVTGRNQSERVAISPKIFFNNLRQLDANVSAPLVNSHGVYQVDTVFAGNGSWYYKESNKNGYTSKSPNLRWLLPDMYSGVDMDIPISKGVSILAGMSYSLKSGKSLYGGSLGLSTYAVSEAVASRFSVGAYIQEYYYDASTILVQKTKELFSSEEQTAIFFFHDIDKCSRANFYMNLTLNSVSERLPFNFFMGFGYFSQTLLYFNPHQPNVESYPWGVQRITTDSRGEASTGYISMFPGVYIDMSPLNRILLGVCVMKEMEGLENLSQSVLVTPFVKIDFML